jgi:hypothetical protein
VLVAQLHLQVPGFAEAPGVELLPVQENLYRGGAFLPFFFLAQEPQVPVRRDLVDGILVQVLGGGGPHVSRRCQ